MLIDNLAYVNLVSNTNNFVKITTTKNEHRNFYE